MDSNRPRKNPRPTRGFSTNGQTHSLSAKLVSCLIFPPPFSLSLSCFLPHLFPFPSARCIIPLPFLSPLLYVNTIYVISQDTRTGTAQIVQGPARWPAGALCISSAQRSDRVWGPPTHPPIRPEGKATGA
jgi:hypothetical protein